MKAGGVRRLLTIQNRQITGLLRHYIALTLDKGSTRAAEAEKIGITPQDLSRWLNGVNGRPWSFTAAAQAKIALWLGRDAIWEMLLAAQELEMQRGEDEDEEDPYQSGAGDDGRSLCLEIRP